MYDLIHAVLLAFMFAVALYWLIAGALWLCGGANLTRRELPATLAACCVAVWLVVTGR
jgi:hypothetical protein